MVKKVKLPLKSRSAESEFPRNRRDSSGHNKVGEKVVIKSDFFKF
jgi:hypothetical protein